MDEAEYCDRMALFRGKLIAEARPMN